MEFADFLRAAEARQGMIMWLLGAGCSQAAGIPTAYDLIWRFKRKIYCTEQAVPETRFRDLASSEVRHHIQTYFDPRPEYPPKASSQEYSFYFERAYPNEADRRRILEDVLEGTRPSFGHYVLAAFLHQRVVRIVWTTNFDSLIEDAAQNVLGAEDRITVADLDSAANALDALNEERWPLIGKLHGDFRSRRLMNTEKELREQDRELRDALIEACGRMGLAVAGYSGRDDSVMDSLRASVESGRKSFPFGLFWFHYGAGEPHDNVTALLDDARRHGIEAELLRVGVFDELFANTSTAFPSATELLEEQPTAPTHRLTPVAVPGRGGGWPVIRSNALPVVSWPERARRVGCKIGGIREVREAIRDADADILATRRSFGVLALGEDDEVRRTFAPYDIRDWDVHRLDLSNSVELGLVYDALAKAIDRDRPVMSRRAGRRQFLIVDPGRVNHPDYKALLDQLNGSLTGTVPETDVGWWEAVALRQEYRLDGFWLLIEPTVFTEWTDNEEHRVRSRVFVTNRMADRYNRVWNELFDAWTDLLCGGRQEVEVAAFDTNNGVDASFSVLGKTAFSRRLS